MEKGKSNCSSSKATCIAIISLCISLVLLVIMFGCCMSKCGKKSSKFSSKKVCYTGDAVSGSTCDYKAKGCCSTKGEAKG